MQYQECNAGEVLFEKGAVADKFFSIIYGKVNMINADEEGNEKILNTLGQGRSFGERGLVLELPRSLGVRCKSNVGLIIVTEKDFEKILQF